MTTLRRRVVSDEIGRMAGRAFGVAAMAIAMVTVPSRVSAQERPLVVVVGVATSETSAEQSTLAIAGVDAATPSRSLTRAWSVRGIGHAGWEPVFTMRGTTPEYREGLRVDGGFRLAHTSARIETALVGQAGATRVADAGGWAAFFEGGVNFRWLAPIVDVYAGLRHDDRLRANGRVVELPRPHRPRPARHQRVSVPARTDRRRRRIRV